MDWKTLFLDGNGRIGRKDFWLAILMLIVASIVAGLIPFLGALISLALLWPQVCVFAKRLHDMGRSAWLILAPAAISLVLGLAMMFVGGAAVMAAGGAFDGAAMASMGLVGLLGLAIFLVNIGFLLWVGLSPSQPGDNRWGPPPRQLIGGQPPIPPATVA